MSESLPTRRDRGMADLVAGAAGGLAAPLATFGLGIPFWISIPLAVLVFFGLRLVLSPRRVFEGFRFGDIDRASLALAREVLEGAYADLERLAAAATSGDEKIRGRLMHLHEIAGKVVKEVERRPARIGKVRRLLTYYLPSAVRLAEGYRVLQGRLVPNRERVLAAEGMIGRLDDVFTNYADKLTDQEVEELDVEIRLLEAELSGERKR